MAGPGDAWEPLSEGLQHQLASFERAQGKSLAGKQVEAIGD